MDEDALDSDEDLNDELGIDTEESDGTSYNCSDYLM